MTWLIVILPILIIFVGLVYLGHKNAKADWGGVWVNSIDGLTRVLCRYLHRLPETEIPLPKTGAAIVAANHVSGLDPLLLAAASRRPLRFMIAREQYERPILHWLFKAAGCIPVDRSGKPEKALRQAMRALEEGEVVALFPHGTIHLDSDPPRKIKGGVVRLAIWSQAPIYPVRIDGVGAEGSVVMAPFIPSHVTLRTSPAIFCEADALAECMKNISRAIEAPLNTK